MIKFSNCDELYDWMVKNKSNFKELFVEIKKGKPKDDGNIYYIDLIYTILCFGWIDSVCKNIDGKLYQRISPRVKNSPWTELNKERCKFLIKNKKMTKDGIIVYNMAKKFEVSDKMKQIIESDVLLKQNFYSFPEIYQRLRIDSIQRHFPYKNRKEMYEKQIENFIKQTRLGKMYGNLNDYGRLF